MKNSNILLDEPSGSECLVATCPWSIVAKAEPGSKVYACAVPSCMCSVFNMVYIPERDDPFEQKESSKEVKFLENLKDEFLTRIKARSSHKSTERLVDTHRRRLFSMDGLKFSDPYKPTPFRRACTEFQHAGQVMESWFQVWITSRSNGGAKFQEADEQIEVWLKKRKEASQRVFSMYLSLIGVDHDPTISFSKALSAKALAGMIGEVGRKGNGTFRYPGLKRDLRTSNPHDDARAFGLYMARKSLAVTDPRDAVQALRDFTERVCTPPPELDEQQEWKKNRLILLLKRVCRTFFRKPKKFVPKAPNSGMACTENGRSSGGKRAAVYGMVDMDPEKVPPREIVKAVPIMSGGKFRVITTSSVHAQRFAWMNEFMFTRLRACKWMVAGRTVKDWVQDYLDGDWFRKGTPWTSGDLKSATDMFSVDFANTVLEHFRDEFFAGDQEVYREMKSYITEAQLFEKDGADWKFLGRQERGQLMGSDFSFPILCLVSFLIGCETKIS
jgi:hypothetical protein